MNNFAVKYHFALLSALIIGTVKQSAAVIPFPPHISKFKLTVVLLTTEGLGSTLRTFLVIAYMTVVKWSKVTSFVSC